MALGNGERRPQVPSDLDEIGRYIPWARELWHKTSAQLATLTGNSVYDDLLTAEADVEKDMLRERIREVLESMSPGRLLGMYATLLPENERGPIRQIAELQQKDWERAARLASLKREAQVSRSLDLRNIEVGEVISVGLFRTEFDDDTKSDVFPHCAARILTLRMRDAETTTFEVLKDWLNYNDSNYSGFGTDCPYLNRSSLDNTPYEKHDLMSLGTSVGGQFEPVLTHATTVTIINRKTDVARELWYDVGFVMHGNDPLLTFVDPAEA